MNPKTAVPKLQGHAKNLLTQYLGVLREYELLDPMIFSKSVTETYGQGAGGEGFRIIRRSLFFGLIQDIANIFYDRGDANPSVTKIRDRLECRAVVDLLRKTYVLSGGESDGGEEFDKRLKTLLILVENLEGNKDLKAYKSIRDKFTAHLELRLVDGEYVYPDIDQYGLKWSSIREIIAHLRPVMDEISFVIRNASFVWELFDEQNTKIASGFWEITDLP